MKCLNWPILVVMIAAISLVACRQNKPAVDTAIMESSFQTADPRTQDSAQRAIDAAKAGNYSTALAELRSLDGRGSLTREQSKAVRDVLAQFHHAMVGAVLSAKTEALKPAADPQKSLPN